MDKKLFRERLVELRTEKGIGQRKLASEIDVARGAIGHWETGRSVPSAEHASSLAQFFNVSVDYLLGNKDEVY